MGLAAQREETATQSAPLLYLAYIKKYSSAGFDSLILLLCCVFVAGVERREKHACSHRALVVIVTPHAPLILSKWCLQGGPEYDSHCTVHEIVEQLLCSGCFRAQLI